MDVRNCKECKRIFQYSGYGDVLCPACKRIDDEQFAKVKTYLSKNPLATGQEVYKETNVPLQKIVKWLRDERLIVPNAKGVLVCEQCGEPISKGKLCDKCKRQLALGFAQAMAEDGANKPAAQKPVAKMQFIHR